LEQVAMVELHKNVQRTLQPLLRPAVFTVHLDIKRDDGCFGVERHKWRCCLLAAGHHFRLPLSGAPIPHKPTSCSSEW